MAHLRELGGIIYIKLPYETIEERLHNIHTRGIAIGKGETLKSLYEKRIPLYEKFAGIIVHGHGLSVEEVVEQIILKTR
jgi:shikimate kinase